MVPEPAVGRIPARVVQHAIELDFQTSRRGQQSVQGDLLVLVALGQGQGLLVHLLHPQREACGARSEEHTSELQSRLHLVCRLLLEKKKDYPTRPRLAAIAGLAMRR